MPSTFERIKQVMGDLGLPAGYGGAITERSRLERMGLNSIDNIELIMALEEEFDVEVKDEDADQADTVEKAVALIDRLVAAKSRR